MKVAARLVFVLGAVAIGWFLFSRVPKDVVLEYDLSGVPEATRLEAEIRRGGDLVRHAEFRLPGRGESIVRHTVSLPRGDYTLAWRIVVPSGELKGERPLDVQESGTIILPLAR